MDTYQILSLLFLGGNFLIALLTYLYYISNEFVVMKYNERPPAIVLAEKVGKFWRS